MNQVTLSSTLFMTLAMKSAIMSRGKVFLFVEDNTGRDVNEMSANKSNKILWSCLWNLPFFIVLKDPYEVCIKFVNKMSHENTKISRIKPMTKKRERKS